MKKITTKDVIFLALLSVVLLLTSSLIMPIVMFTQIFALRNLFGAIFFGMFCIIALHRVPKLGALSLIGLFTGGFLGFMSVIMLVNNLVGAVVAELLVWLIFRGYDNVKARYFAAAIYMPLTVPITLLSTLWLRGTPLSEQLKNPTMSILIFVGTCLISCGAVFVGNKIAMELRKAGKLAC